MFSACQNIMIDVCREGNPTVSSTAQLFSVNSTADMRPTSAQWILGDPIEQVFLGERGRIYALVLIGAAPKEGAGEARRQRGERWRPDRSWALTDKELNAKGRGC